jgi:hypothetical protein
MAKPEAKASNTTTAAKKAANARAAAAMKGMAAKDRPVNSGSKRPTVHTESDIFLPDDKSVDLSPVLHGDMQAIRQTGDIKKFMHDEAFMHDLLLIQINHPGENENPYAVVVVNNREFRIPRGRQVRVKRFVVEALAHAKQASFKTKRSLPGSPDHMATQETHTFSYPFGVVTDPKGTEGFAWLEKVMSDPN